MHVLTHACVVYSLCKININGVFYFIQINLIYLNLSDKIIIMFAVTTQAYHACINTKNGV